MKHRIQIIGEDISKVDDTFPVQTAGNHGTVAQNAEMILQTVAEHTVSHILAGGVGPCEAVSELQMKLVLNTVATVALLPFPFQMGAEELSCIDR